MSYILNCLVLGQNPFEKCFQFQLDTSKIPTIGLLKNAIITEIKLDVLAKDVKLWKVNLPITDTSEEEKLNIINICKNINANIGDELGGVELPICLMSNEEFITQQDLKHAHILLQISAGK